MIEPFLWMFKTENFSKHVFYLCLTYIKFFVLAAIAFILGVVFFTSMPLVSVIYYVIGGFFLICPLLCVQGYFWALTENIISRDWDINASSIYNGKVKDVFKVKLPEIKTAQFIWRGVASIVATAMMFIPFVLLLTSGTLLTTLTSLPLPTVIVMYIFLCSFIPALLWNYASRDSVFAVWNIRKAIYLMGTYTGKYCLNVLLFLIFYLLDYALLALLAIILGVNDTSSILAMDPFTIVKVALFYIISYVQYIYCIYVYAYLLGTIAPPHES